MKAEDRERLLQIAYGLETGYFRDGSAAAIEYALDGATFLRSLADSNREAPHTEAFDKLLGDVLEFVGMGGDPDLEKISADLRGALAQEEQEGSGVGEGPGITMRPASAARLALQAAVLQCIENDVHPETIRDIVDQELPHPQPDQDPVDAFVERLLGDEALDAGWPRVGPNHAAYRRNDRARLEAAIDTARKTEGEDQ